MAPRAHAAVDLELAALIDLGVAGALLAARQQGAQHDHVGAAANALAISPEYLIPPSAMMGTPYSAATRAAS